MSFNCFVIEIHLPVPMAPAGSVLLPAQAGIGQRQFHLGPWLDFCLHLFSLPMLEQIRKNWGPFLRQEKDLIWNAGRMEKGNAFVLVPKCSQ